MLENGWRDGSIYVLEIVLYDADMAEWFGTNYDPEYEEPEKGILTAEMPEEITRKYWGVKRVVCKTVPLTDIRYENAYEMIFGTFKELRYK